MDERKTSNKASQRKDRSEPNDRQSPHVSNGWHAIFQAINHPAIILSPQFTIIEANNAAEKLTGTPAGQLIGRQCYEIFHGTDGAAKGCPLVSMLENGLPQENEMPVETAGGTYLVSCTPVLDEQGNLEKVIHIATDITERKKMEESLRQSEHKYRELIEHANSIILRWTPDGRLTYMNEFGQKFFGYAEFELIGRHVMDTIVPATESTGRDLRPLMDEICKDPKQFERNENENICRDGRRVWIAWTNKVVFGDDGGIAEILSIGSDMTEQKRATEKMREAMERLTLATDSAQIGVWDYDIENNVLIWDDRMYEIFGVFRDQAENRLRAWIEAIHPDDRETVKNKFKKAIDDTSPCACEYRIVCPGGAVKHLIAYGKLIRGGSGKAVRMIGINRDISERKRAEEAVLEQQHFAHNLIMNASVAIFVLGKDHAIMLWNKACEELTGYTAADMVGTDNQWRPFYAQKRPTAADVILDGAENRLPELYSNYSRSTLDPRGIKAEGWYTMLGGKKRYIVFEASPITNDAGDMVAAIETLSDLTDMKLLEAQLVQAQKMEAIGQLTGGIAHDFNNMLSAIIGFGHVMKMEMTDADPMHRYLDPILETADKAATLTKDLLTFSRKQAVVLSPVDLNRLAVTFKAMARRIIREDIHLDVRCIDGELTVLADKGQIDQVLMNLIANARDAMPEGGLISIMTDSVAIDEAFIRVHGYGAPGRYAVITVSDSGTGMDEATQQQIFSPFFTTKEVGKGTGLGLSIVYGIVKQHNGYINVYSEPGRGTTFRIYLPVAESKPEEKSAAQTAVISRGTETILCVEDDPGVRAMLKAVLEGAGYKTILAADGASGLDTFIENRDRIAIALVDVIMPKMNGKELYQKMKAIDQAVPVVFLSGYTSDIISTQRLADEGADFLSKPFTPAVLLRKVREVLDAASGKKEI